MTALLPPRLPPNLGLAGGRGNRARRVRPAISRAHRGLAGCSLEAGWIVEEGFGRLTAGRRAKVAANCDHLSRLRYAPALSNAFTEYGAVIVANVLNTPRAVQVSVAVMDAFALEGRCPEAVASEPTAAEAAA